MKVHIVEVDGRSKVINGKLHWPDCFHLSMPNFHAWNLVHSLLTQLRQNEKNITHSFCGKLEYDIDEDA